MGFNLEFFHILDTQLTENVFDKKLPQSINEKIFSGSKQNSRIPLTK